MRYRIVGKLILLCLLTFVGCFQKQDYANTQIFDHLPNGGKKGFYLIIPISGCHSCVDKSLDVLRSNIHKIRSSKEFEVLFTELSEDSKVNFSRLSPEFTEGFVIDSLNSFRSNVFSQGKLPTLIQSSGNHIIKMQPIITKAELQNIIDKLN